MVSVRLPEALEEKINQASAATRQTKSDIIKEALNYYFDHREEEAAPYIMGEELFGRYGSGETDRSQTYKTRLKAKLAQKNPR